MGGKLTPAVRAYAEELKLTEGDLELIEPTRESGYLTKADLNGYAESLVDAPEPPGANGPVEGDVPIAEYGPALLPCNDEFISALRFADETYVYYLMPMGRGEYRLTTYKTMAKFLAEDIARVALQPVEDTPEGDPSVPISAQEVTPVAEAGQSSEDGGEPFEGTNEEADAELGIPPQVQVDGEDVGDSEVPKTSEMEKVPVVDLGEVKATEPSEAPEETEPEDSQAGEPVDATDAAFELAAEAGLDISENVVGTGKDGRISVKDVRKAIAEQEIDEVVDIEIEEDPAGNVEDAIEAIEEESQAPTEF